MLLRNKLDLRVVKTQLEEVEICKMITMTEVLSSENIRVSWEEISRSQNELKLMKFLKKECYFYSAFFYCGLISLLLISARILSIRI